MLVQPQTCDTLPLPQVGVCVVFQGESTSVASMGILANEPHLRNYIRHKYMVELLRIAQNCMRLTMYRYERICPLMFSWCGSLVQYLHYKETIAFVRTSLTRWVLTDQSISLTARV